MTLYDAGEDVEVKIIQIEGNWTARHQLRELGLHVGDSVRVLRRAPLGGPVAVRNLHTTLAVGRQIARKIKVESAP